MYLNRNLYKLSNRHFPMRMLLIMQIWLVNADAEQVIIAANENETLSYDSGGIENVTIRDQICSILEGGKDAFTKREQKYGFVNL